MISTEHIALKVADVQYQLCHTTTGGGHPLFTFIAGFDIFTGQPELYAVDFSGRVGRFGAYAAGRGLELMNKFLRNNYQKEYSARELAVRALLEVNSPSFSLFGLRVIYVITYEVCTVKSHGVIFTTTTPSTTIM